MAEKSGIIVHHSATADGEVLRDIDAIRRHHTQTNGWRDIGYHWIIERVDGVYTSVPGRPESDDGAHCAGRNKDSIGLCLVGDWSYQEPPAEAYVEMERRIRDICTRHTITRISGHNEHAATACPGKINIERLRRVLEKTDPAMTVEAAQRIIMNKAGVSQETISYLWSYRWGDELILKLAGAMK